MRPTNERAALVEAPADPPHLPGDVAGELLAQIHRLLDIIERSCDHTDEAFADLERVKARLSGAEAEGPLLPAGCSWRD